jgi:FkbM family methyltransferase
VPKVRINFDSRPAFLIETHGLRDEFVSRTIHRYGNWDAASTRIIRELLSHDADFIDVGANIGWFTLVAADALRGRGNIHSFEPDPRHVAKLSASVRHNRYANVTVNAWALSDYTGEGRLYLNETNLGDHRLFDLGPQRRSRKVAIRTLDSYPRIDPARPLVLKFDIQGSEAKALRGAQRTIARHTGEMVILLELSPRLLDAAGSSMAELVSYLRATGFLPAVVDHSRLMVQPITWERLVARCLEAMEAHPNHETDVLLFRRHDGIAASTLQLGRG